MDSLIKQIKQFYLENRVDGDDQSWNHFYVRLSSEFPDCKFQFIMNSEILIIKCSYLKDSFYLRCKYDDNSFIQLVNEDEIIQRLL